MILLPPMGGARQAATSLVAGWNDGNTLPPPALFDCKKYQDAFSRLLRTPDDTMVVDLLNQSLVVQALDAGITHLLVPALAPVTRFTLRLLRKQGVFCTHWFFEDYRRATYWKSVFEEYNLFAAIQRGPVESACKRSGTAYAFLPTATSFSHPPQPPHHPPERDIAFIGIPGSYRTALLCALSRAGYSLALAGPGWEKAPEELRRWIATDSWVEGEAFSRVVYRAKISLNCSLSSPDENGEHTHVSPRLYDLMYHGVPVVTEDVPLLCDALQEGSVHQFSNETTLVETVRSIIDSYDACKTKAEANIAVIDGNHRYRHRAETLRNLAETQSSL